jgi:hypothetical protein
MFEEQELLNLSFQREGLNVKVKPTWEELNTPEKWLAWLTLMKEIEPFMYECWSDILVCTEHDMNRASDCQHLDKKHFWCTLQDLPASFNPVFKGLGMACMGMGYEADLHEA